MRLELLYNPRLLCERFAIESLRWRRLKKLHGTVAQSLSLGHIDSLELLEIARPLGIRSIYDIGANVGTWSLLAKAVIPEAGVEAFEPLARHCEAFGRALQGAGGVRLHKVALGPENTTATLRVTDFSDASSLLPLAEASRSQFGLKEVEQVSSLVRRLDDYRIESGLPLPDLLKLDVQGYELEVLKGAAECLRSVKAVITEVSFSEYYQGQCFFHEVVEFLAGRGLFVTALGVNTPTGSPVNQTDVLFTRPARSPAPSPDGQ
jgi:FkbM family methyltransferase